MFWMVPPRRRTAPTPTPVATAAASAWRRVNPLRTGGAVSVAGSGTLSAMGPLNPGRKRLASPRCEEFVSTVPLNTDAANAPRCQDRSGTYEAWYLTASDVSSRRGYWLRYTAMNPAAGVSAEPRAALWAFAFDRDHPEANWGGKVTFPLRALRTSTRPFGLRLEGAVLERDGCVGHVHTESGMARWDLSSESREPPFPFLRPRWQGLSSVANIGAQPALSISGTIEVNGREHRLEAVPAGQRPTWGPDPAPGTDRCLAYGPGFSVDCVTTR